MWAVGNRVPRPAMVKQAVPQPLGQTPRVGVGVGKPILARMRQADPEVTPQPAREQPLVGA